MRPRVVITADVRPKETPVLIEWFSMKRSFSGPAEIVFQALDVVFAEVVATLHLDEDDVLLSGVGHAMCLPGADVDGFARSPERCRGRRG